MYIRTKLSSWFLSLFYSNISFTSIKLQLEFLTHFCWSLVDDKTLDIRFKGTNAMVADLLTKSLPRVATLRHRRKLGLRNTLSRGDEVANTHPDGLALSGSVVIPGSDRADRP